MNRTRPLAPASGAPALAPRGLALTGVVVGLMLTLLLDALDQNVVGTAMPRIIGQLGGFDRYTWTVTAYFLTMTTAIPIAGKLSDQFGRKWFVVGGGLLFLIGSALCGSAQTIDQLIVFRAVQGAGGGIGIALVYTVVADLFPPAERARWQGILAGVTGCAAVFGPTLGGVLADHGPVLGSLIGESSRWRWVFLINLPVGLVALLLLILYLPTTVSGPSALHQGWSAIQRIDVAGATLAAAATLGLLVGLTLIGTDAASTTPVTAIAVLLGAGALYVAFAVAERHAVEPILPLGLLRDRVFAANGALSFLLMMALFGAAFYVPMYLQGVLGASPTESGAAMTPFSISIPVGAFLSGTALSRFKHTRGITLLGAVLMTAGLFFLTRLTLSTSITMIASSIALAGLGMGLLFPATTVVAQNVVPPSQLGVGTGAVRYLGQVGGLVGIAIVGSIVSQAFAIELHQRLPVTAQTYVAPEGMTSQTEIRALVDPVYRQTIVETAFQSAAARVPSGPEHDQAVITANAQVRGNLDEAFTSMRRALTAAVQRGLIVVLGFGVAALLAALASGDVSLADPPRQSAEDARASAT